MPLGSGDGHPRSDVVTDGGRCPAADTDCGKLCRSRRTASQGIVWLRNRCDRRKHRGAVNALCIELRQGSDRSPGLPSGDGLAIAVYSYFVAAPALFDGCIAEEVEVAGWRIMTSRYNAMTARLSMWSMMPASKRCSALASINCAEAGSLTGKILSKFRFPRI